MKSVSPFQYSEAQFTQTYTELVVDWVNKNCARCWGSGDKWVKVLMTAG